MTITLSGSGREQKVDFLLSQDGKTLAKVTKMDLTKDIYGERMSKIDVKDRPVRGNPNAKVTVVNYDDLQCPFCSRMHTTLMQEILPLNTATASRSCTRISRCPCIPGRRIRPTTPIAWRSRMGPLSGTLPITFTPIRRPSAAGQDLQKSTAELDRIALDMGKKHGADMTRLQACIKSQPDKPLKASMAEGESLGLNATPTLFINGQKLEGAVDADEVRAVLNAQLLAAGIQPPAPAAPAKPETTSK